MTSLRLTIPYSGQRRLTAISVMMLFFSNSCSSISPHENFKNALYGENGWPSHIGESINERNPRAALNPDPNALIDVSPLANGNVEYKYRHGFKARESSCRIIYEVDPTTRLIVAARFEGEEDCVLVP